jgi:hypothetical protein
MAAFSARRLVCSASDRTVFVMPPISSDVESRRVIVLCARSPAVRTSPIASSTAMSARSPSRATSSACSTASRVLAARLLESCEEPAIASVVSRLRSTAATCSRAPSATSTAARAISSTARPVSAEASAISREAWPRRPAEPATSPTSVRRSSVMRPNAMPSASRSDAGSTRSVRSPRAIRSAPSAAVRR